MISILRKCTLASLLLFASSAFAYIPPYWMIMSRVAENHGKGVVQIDQEVVFRHGDEPIIVGERWFITDASNMRVEVFGKRQMKDLIRMTYVYENDKRYYIDENGVKKSESTLNDLFEPYFHFRYSKNIKPKLVAQDIAPAESLKSMAHKYSEKTPFPPAEPYVRLARVGGAVNYNIGTPSSGVGADLLPGIWIEQDQFNIRKLRLKSRVLITADDYKEYSAKLFLPKTRRVAWNDQAAEITITGVKTFPATAKSKELLSSSSLNFGKDPNLSRVLPEDAVIKEFFTRMR